MFRSVGIVGGDDRGLVFVIAAVQNVVDSVKDPFCCPGSTELV